VNRVRRWQQHQAARRKCTEEAVPLAAPASPDWCPLVREYASRKTGGWRSSSVETDVDFCYCLISEATRAVPPLAVRLLFTAAPLLSGDGSMPAATAGWFRACERALRQVMGDGEPAAAGPHQAATGRTRRGEQRDRVGTMRRGSPPPRSGSARSRMRWMASARSASRAPMVAQFGLASHCAKPPPAGHSHKSPETGGSVPGRGFGH
jgi:hypothetical protein